MVGSKGWSNPN